MISLNQKPGPSGSGGSGLMEQLQGSVLIADCERLLEEARTSRSRTALEMAGAILGSEGFKALPHDERMHLHVLFSEAFLAVTGYGA